MKKLLLLMLLLICASSFAQEKFEIKKGEGFTDFIVYEASNLSAIDLKAKTLEFIESKKKTENDEIIKEDENSITFNYFVPGGITYKYGNRMNISYDIEVLVYVEFKEGRYKYDLINTYWSKNAVKKALTTIDMDNMFKSNGKLRSYGEGFVKGLENSVNDFANDLNQYLNGNTKSKSDW